MPSAGAETSNKRPQATSRNSSGSVKFSQSPADALSSSAQRQRNPRHVVGQARLGPRVPSFSRNANKLAKLTPAYETAAAAKGHPRRNLSNLQLLTHNNSTTALRKNHSETSLKKNRSSGHLTNLKRPHSSKSALKAGRPSSGKKRNSGQHFDAHDEPVNPTVRFDLGDEDEEPEEVDGDEDDGWVDSASHSASTTKSNTRRNSMINAQDALDSKTSQENEEPGGANGHTDVDTHQSGHTTANGKDDPSMSAASTLRNSQPPDADRITSKLLKRNTSFTAAPRVSSVSAGVQSETISQTGTLVDHTGSRELVSRFIEPSKSEEGTPREDSTISQQMRDRLNGSKANGHSPDEGYTHNRTKNQSSHASSPHSGAVTPNARPLPSSRTQQKLWLERASASIEPQHTQPPIGLLRSNRLSTVNLPFTATATNGDGRLNPQLRQLFDQSDSEYRRIRMFQNPLADAIKRLQNTGDLELRDSNESRQSDGKSAYSNGKYHTKPNQSQTLPARRSDKLGAVEADGRKPRVTFQGVKGSKDDGEVETRKSSEEDEADREAIKAQRAEAREICRRMWDLSLISNEG